MKLLIVEDNAGMRRLIKAVIANAGDAVYELSDGAGALDAYTEHRPDWVLMDVKMPHVDGIVAARQIKAAFPEARIIIVSQYNDPEIRESARQAGADAYVLKDQLLTIRRILDSKAGQSGEAGS